MKRLSARERRFLGGLTALTAIGVGAWAAGLVDRPPPPIRSAMHALGANQYPEAIAALERGAGLAPCTSGSYGAPGDLAEPLLVVDLAQVHLARSLAADGGEAGAYGLHPPTSKEGDLAARCARSAAQLVAKEREFPRPLRARAATLAGHAAFLLGDDEAAIASYDTALSLGDGGREATEDAAWNRSLALKRLQSAKDPPPDGGPRDPDGNGDGGSDAGSGNDAGNDAGDGGNDAGDGGNDAGDGGKDGGNDGGNAGDAAADAGAGTNDSSLLDRLGKLPGLPATLRRDPAGPRVLPGAEDK